MRTWGSASCWRQVRTRGVWGSSYHRGTWGSEWVGTHLRLARVGTGTGVLVDRSCAQPPPSCPVPQRQNPLRGSDAQQMDTGAAGRTGTLGAPRGARGHGQENAEPAAGGTPARGPAAGSQPAPTPTAFLLPVTWANKLLLC